MREAPWSRRVFILKHVSGMCRVGKFMKQWTLRQDDSCLRCGDLEDAAHLWLCHGKGTNDIWERAITNLDKWLNSKQTDPDIQHMIIITHIRSWREEQPRDASSCFISEDLLQNLSNIGWR